MERGDYLSFKIDLKNNEMEVCEIGPVLRQFWNPGEGKAMPITPFVRALECLTRLNPQEEPLYHYLADVQYDRETLRLKLHCAEDYASVVDVSRDRLKKVLGGLLTPRELEIAILLFYGRTIRCIAAALYITEGTVKRTIYNIYRKLNVGSQVELVREVYVRLAQYYSR